MNWLDFIARSAHHSAESRDMDHSRKDAYTLSLASFEGLIREAAEVGFKEGRPDQFVKALAALREEVRAVAARREFVPAECVALYHAAFEVVRVAADCEGEE